MAQPIIPAVLRGTTVTARPAPFGGSFRSPEPAELLDRLPLNDPLDMRDLLTVTDDQVVDYLAELGERLVLSRNAFLRDALAQSVAWSDLTPPLLRAAYAGLPALFTPDAVRAIIARTVGAHAMERWNPVPSTGGRAASVRAVGARCVHIIAGNSPVIAALTIIRNAVARGDAIIKTPANDPATAPAIARTMAAMAPDHPLTRHLAVAYWKGGDEPFEQRLYRPRHVDKIVAWGGLAAVRHVTRYIRPGLELICLDPKLSTTIIGAEAFADEDTVIATARHAAIDVGALNQLGCFNARVIYLVTGTDEDGRKRANRWGELLYDEIQRLPAPVSTKPARFDPDLRDRVRALRVASEWFHVVGGHDDEGAVIVSQLPEPVDFHPTLSGRVANVVPVDDPHHAVRSMSAYTQTVGVFPESLKRELRDVVPLYGAQRLVSLGHATRVRPDLPQDAMEPVRRMVKWVVDETYPRDDRAGGDRP